MGLHPLRNRCAKDATHPQRGKTDDERRRTGPRPEAGPEGVGQGAEDGEGGGAEEGARAQGVGAREARQGKVWLSARGCRQRTPGGRVGGAVGRRGPFRKTSPRGTDLGPKAISGAADFAPPTQNGTSGSWAWASASRGPSAGADSASRWPPPSCRLTQW